MGSDHVQENPSMKAEFFYASLDSIVYVQILSISANLPLKDFQTEAENSCLLTYAGFNLLCSLRKENGISLKVQMDLQRWWSGYFLHRAFIATVKLVSLSVLHMHTVVL